MATSAQRRVVSYRAERSSPHKERDLLMNDSQSNKPSPSIFFVPGAAPISEDITSKHFESAERPREDIWNLLFRSITTEWLKKTGMTRGELLQQAMESPAVPYGPVWETTELFCPNCGAKGL